MGRMNASRMMPPVSFMYSCVFLLYTPRHREHVIEKLAQRDGPEGVRRGLASDSAAGSDLLNGLCL